MLFVILLAPIKAIHLSFLLEFHKNYLNLYELSFFQLLHYDKNRIIFKDYQLV